jgi:hypothetical protein
LQCGGDPPLDELTGGSANIARPFPAKPCLDFSVLLHEVMTIADEVDSQFSQAMESYIAESLDDAVPA